MKISSILGNSFNQHTVTKEANQITEIKEDENIAEKAASLELSEETRKMYEEQAKDSDKAAEAFADMAKLMEIARRISNGDKVPAKDEKKLMEYNSDLYQAAKAAALVNANKKHKKYDSMFEEENEDSKREKLRELEQENSGEGRTAAVTDGSCADAATDIDSTSDAAAQADCYPTPL